MRHETDLLVRMQSGMLPRRLPEVPSGYENGTGGNLYSVLRDDGGHLWIASGDVDGEGYACSIAQSMIKAALRSLIAPGLLPSQVLRHTGEVLRGVDPQRNRAAWHCCGSTPDRRRTERPSPSRRWLNRR